MVQEPVTPLPDGIDLEGQTALVTGASAGQGLEISRQLVSLNISTLILAVRNVPKGEKVKIQLKALSPSTRVEVLKLDMEDYGSVQDFVKELTSKFPEVHIAMLNAGVATLHKETALTGHEKDTQVNYLSNVLLTIGLVPLLEAASLRTGKPSRLTWTGSRAYYKAFFKDHPVPQGSSMLKHIDAFDADSYGRYGNSKLLVLLFQRELARHYGSDRVIVNNFCPGPVHSTMHHVLPIYLRMPFGLWSFLTRRSVEKATWIALNAALVAGKETHGGFLRDKNLDE